MSRRILASFDQHGIDVYQAFEPRIADDAVRRQRFGIGFGLDRMSWIKPSFGWMLYRSGYATKHRQERIVRVTIQHDAFIRILGEAVPTAYDPALYASKSDWSVALRRHEARYQWDPDRDLYCRPLERRALQVGLSGALLRDYATTWIVCVVDVTELAHATRDAVIGRTALPDVPTEREYPVPPEVARQLGIA